MMLYRNEDLKELSHSKNEKKKKNLSQGWGRGNSLLPIFVESYHKYDGECEM